MVQLTKIPIFFSQQSPGSAHRPRQDKSNEHAKTHSNRIYKNERQKNIKSNKGKTTNNIQRNSHKVISWVLGETLQAEGSGTIYLKWWKGRTYNQEYSQQNSPLELMEKSKFYRQAKGKRIQHHQTNFATNAKEL